MQFPILYKLDSKNKVRQWEIIVDEGDVSNYPSYTQIHGTRGGKLVSTSTYVKEGKNIGRANETTASEQCVLEAQALWNKKRDRDGYTEDIPTEKPFRPMLAKDYRKPEDRKHIKFPCFCQPKLNGLRCLATVKSGQVKLVSRKNTEWKSLIHLVKELSKFPDGCYDGELYIHGPDFRDIVGAVKRDEANSLSSLIELHIYDMVREDLSFQSRHALIKGIIEKHYCKFVKPVLTKTIETADDVERIHDMFVTNGYEGIMLRNLSGGYKINGRSKDLQKFKKFVDDEFEIVGAKENIGGWVGTCTFRCITSAGHEFDVMPEGDFATRSKYWEDWNSGKIKPGDKLTVKYFGYTTTDKPVPYIPTGLSVRNYE